MDPIVIILALIAVAIVFYAGLRAYTRRQMKQGHRTPDVD